MHPPCRGAWEKPKKKKKNIHPRLPFDCFSSSFLQRHAVMCSALAVRRASWTRPTTPTASRATACVPRWRHPTNTCAATTASSTPAPATYGEPRACRANPSAWLMRANASVSDCKIKLPTKTLESGFSRQHSKPVLTFSYSRDNGSQLLFCKEKSWVSNCLQMLATSACLSYY